MEQAEEEQEESKKEEDAIPEESEEQIPEAVVEEVTLDAILQEVPVKERYKMTESERAEFTAYLRPVMYKEVFPDLRNGWKFLAGHINQDNDLFNKVLTKRHNYD